MNLCRTAIFPIAALILCGCGSHVATPAAFCKAFDKAQTQASNLKDNATKPEMQKAARAMEHLAYVAPSDIKGPAKVEASDWRILAKGNKAAANKINKFAYESAVMQITGYCIRQSEGLLLSPKSN